MKLQSQVTKKIYVRLPKNLRAYLKSGNQNG